MRIGIFITLGMTALSFLVFLIFGALYNKYEQEWMVTVAAFSFCCFVGGGLACYLGILVDVIISLVFG